MTGTSIILPLATIEEIDEIDESMEENIDNIIDKNGKRVLIDKFK
jgi:hypothetical protein